MMNESHNKAGRIPFYGNEWLISQPEGIFTDPFGSYTGLVKDEDEKPVQDADDL